MGGLTQDISNLEVAKKILKIMGKADTELEMIKDRPGHDRRYAIDWQKIKQELGWSPQHSFDQALEETIKWYQEHQQWWSRVKSGDYQTYYQKQYTR